MDVKRCEHETLRFIADDWPTPGGVFCETCRRVWRRRRYRYYSTLELTNEQKPKENECLRTKTDRS